MKETRGRTEDARRLRGGRPWRLTVLVLAAALSTACNGDKPDPGPIIETDLKCPAAQVPLCTDAVAEAAARDASSDAVSRSVGALEDATVRSALESVLRKLQTAITDRNITKAREAIRDSRNALAVAGSAAADAPDRGAIELMLDYVDPLIR